MTLSQLWQETFPTASRPDSINPPQIFARYDRLVEAYAAFPDAEADTDLYDVAKELFELDRERRASIFARAQGLLPAIGIAVALVSSIGYGLLAKRADLAAMPVPAQFGLIVCYVATVWFLVWSAVLVLQVQGSQTTHTLGPEEVVPRAPMMTSPAFKRGITVARLKAVVANYKATNSRMDLLNTAQKNIRNATVAIAVGGVVPVVVWLLGAHHGAPSLGNPY